MDALPPNLTNTPLGPTQRGQPDWAEDGVDWPNRAQSRFCTAGGIRWHVQIAGKGPILLLIHGTGAATHSWRDLLLPLSAHYTVIAPDLPGHGFTQQPARDKMSLPGMARGVAALLEKLGLQPEYAAGHSAGAAILIQMCLENLMAPKTIVSLNGALLPYGGHGAPFFAPLARLIARNPVLPILFSWHAADHSVVEKLLAGTGSKLDSAGTRFYARLARRSGHTGAALAMMGNWDLALFSKKLAGFSVPLILVVGQNDRSIPPAEAERIATLIPTARIIRLPGLGHLAHEEDPETALRIIEEVCS
jgi:magnesium chelatase accessory protein